MTMNIRDKAIVTAFAAALAVGFCGVPAVAAETPARRSNRSSMPTLG